MIFAFLGCSSVNNTNFPILFPILSTAIPPEQLEVVGACSGEEATGSTRVAPLGAKQRGVGSCKMTVACALRVLGVHHSVDEPQLVVHCFEAGRLICFRNMMSPPCKFIGLLKKETGGYLGLEIRSYLIASC